MYTWNKVDALHPFTLVLLERVNQCRCALISLQVASPSLLCRLLKLKASKAGSTQDEALFCIPAVIKYSIPCSCSSSVWFVYFFRKGEVNNEHYGSSCQLMRLERLEDGTWKQCGSWTWGQICVDPVLSEVWDESERYSLIKYQCFCTAI